MRAAVVLCANERDIEGSRVIVMVALKAKGRLAASRLAVRWLLDASGSNRAQQHGLCFDRLWISALPLANGTTVCGSPVGLLAAKAIGVSLLLAQFISPLGLVGSCADFAVVAVSSFGQPMWAELHNGLLAGARPANELDGMPRMLFDFGLRQPFCDSLAMLAVTLNIGLQTRHADGKPPVQAARIRLTCRAHEFGSQACRDGRLQSLRLAGLPLLWSAHFQ